MAWWGVKCRRHSNGGAEGPDGDGDWGAGCVGLCPFPEKFGMFSFEMVHFDASWSFRPNIIATVIFMKPPSVEELQKMDLQAEV